MGSNQRTLPSDWIFASVVKKKMALPWIGITFVILVLILAFFSKRKALPYHFSKLKNSNSLSAFQCKSKIISSSLPSPPPTNPPHISVPGLTGVSGMRTHAEGCPQVFSIQYKRTAGGCLYRQKSFWETT